MRSPSLGGVVMQSSMELEGAPLSQETENPPNDQLVPGYIEPLANPLSQETENPPNNQVVPGYVNHSQNDQVVPGYVDPLANNALVSMPGGQGPVGGLPVMFGVYEDNLVETQPLVDTPQPLEDVDAVPEANSQTALFDEANVAPLGNFFYLYDI